MTDVATPWLTAAEAASAARVSTKAIHAAIRNGKLRAAVVDRRGTVRIHESWIQRWLEELASCERPIERQRLAAGDHEQPERLRVVR